MIFWKENRENVQILGTSMGKGMKLKVRTSSRRLKYMSFYVLPKGFYPEPSQCTLVIDKTKTEQL